MTGATTTPPPLDPRPTRPVEVVGSLYGAFAAGDIDAVLEGVHPDVDWGLQVDAPGAERARLLRNGRGHVAVRAYFASVAELEFHVFEPHTFREDGDVVLVELRLDATHRNTGKRAAIDEIHRFVVRDGQVVHYRPFVDTATLVDLYQP